MNRRVFLAGVGSSLLAVPLVAGAQQAGKVYRVGFILISPVATIKSDPTNPFNSAFRPGMRDRGYIEGQNLILDLRSVEGRLERTSEIVAELVGLKVDVIVTASLDMTRRAKRVTTTVPIVTFSRAPVEEGLVVTLARPGGNITGVTNDTGPDVEGKRLELLKESLSKLRQVAYLGAKSEWEGAGGRSMRAAAKSLGLTLFLAEPRLNDYGSAFNLVAGKRPDAIIISQGAIHYSHRRLRAQSSPRFFFPDTSATEIGYPA